jgi:predicted AAA+ superfamily ATPase
MPTVEAFPDERPIQRVLDLGVVARKSHFLFGPRQTGKTFLVAHALPRARVYDLLDGATYLALSREPGRIEQELTPGDEIVVIDEIQRLPELLNEVHRLIEKRRIHFLLTGSSARKLRRGGVNLLGGRARTLRLHPLCYRELGERLDLAAVAKRGLLPAIYLSDDPRADLEAYVGSYLEHEVAAEGATRNIPAFSRFLKVAAACNGSIVNFTKVGNDAQVARTTVYEYFDILRDTLLVHELPAWRQTRKRKPIASSKYYFFDIGVAATLQGRELRAGTTDFGEAFETYLMHELVCYRDYVSREPLAHWRSTSGFEVDFILGEHTAIEVKARENVSDRDLKALRAIAEEKQLRRYVCVCLAKSPRRVDGMEILPWREFLGVLWSGEFR